jgi:copper homeostasis protein (lipoprotein)
MTNKTLFASVLCVIALVAVGCKREQAPAPATTEAAVPEATPAATPADTAADIATAPASAPVAVSDSAELNTKGFSGTFTGSLPCADCSGIDTTLQLAADGSYTLDETYRGKPGGASRSDGTWTFEADNKQIRLDPNSKSGEDRLYAVTSFDRITQLGPDGKPADGKLDYSLGREGAAQ